MEIKRFMDVGLTSTPAHPRIHAIIIFPVRKCRIGTDLLLATTGSLIGSLACGVNYNSKKGRVQTPRTTSTYENTQLLSYRGCRN